MTEFAKSQYQKRLEPFLNRFGYQKAKWYRPLLEHDMYDYLLIKPNRSFKVRIGSDWSVQDRRPLFLIFWIDVPCSEKFMIHTDSLQEVAQSILFDSYWPRQNLDDWTSLGLQVVSHPQNVGSLRNRLNSPLMQTTLQALLNVKASFYLFTEVNSGFWCGIALSEPLEQKAATWLSAVEKLADVFDVFAEDGLNADRKPENNKQTLLAVTLILPFVLFVLLPVLLFFFLISR